MDKGLEMFDDIGKMHKCQVAVNGECNQVKFPPFTNPPYFFCTNDRNFRIVGTCYLTDFTVHYRNKLKCIGFLDTLKSMISLESLEFYTDKSFVVKNQLDFDWFLETHIKYMHENGIKDSLIPSKIKYFSLRSDINVRNDDINVYSESLIGFTIDYLVIFSKERAEYIAKRAPKIKYLCLSKCVVIDKDCLDVFGNLVYFCYRGCYMIVVPKTLKMLIYFPKYHIKEEDTIDSCESVRKYLTPESVTLCHYFSTQFRSYVSVYNSHDWNYFVFFNNKKEYSKHLDVINVTRCDNHMKYKE